MVRLLLTIGWLMLGTSLAMAATPQELWDRASEGDVAAQHQLGLHHLDKTTTDFDINAARYWLDKAAQGGSAEAATELGLLILDSRINEAETGLAISHLSHGVAAGLARAQYHMATIQAKGLLGLAADPEQGRRLMRLSAAQGFAPAQTALAVFYYQGIGGEQSVAEAEELFRVAAEAGEPLAQYHMAVLYLSGHYGAPDEASADTWLDRAVKQALPQALLMRGRLDLGQAKSSQAGRAAVAMIERAAGFGLADAQLVLGRIRAIGKVGQADPEAAVKWYWLAAEQGHPDAQYYLAEHLLAGKGAPQDIEGALDWLHHAAAQGQPQAIARLDQLNRQAQTQQSGKE